ncbi:hypothetical protein [Methanobrevibacter sp.]|uniref:hypothetical protein n=1 Tax=Methanobrevibacter sp. TaxID=66852 RepID=UPI0038911006
MSSSGVLKVYRKGNSSWVYNYHEEGKLKALYDKSLFKLEKKVKKLNLAWIIKDEELYEELISRDLEEYEDFCILDEY